MGGIFCCCVPLLLHQAPCTAVGRILFVLIQLQGQEQVILNCTVIDICVVIGLDQLVFLVCFALGPVQTESFFYTCVHISESGLL